MKTASIGYLLAMICVCVGYMYNCGSTSEMEQEAPTTSTKKLEPFSSTYQTVYPEQYTYQLSGTAYQAGTLPLLPIDGIRVEFFGTSTVTQNGGYWQIVVEATFPPCFDDECDLIVQDIDGAANGGEFLQQSVPTELELYDATYNSYYNRFWYRQHHIELKLELAD